MGTENSDNLFIIQRKGVHESSGGSATVIVSAWERRSLDLATRRRYRPTDTMHWHTSADGTASYLVRSDTLDVPYRVTIHPESDHRHTCDCPAGEHQRPCKHVGICLILWAKFDRPVWAGQEREGKSHEFLA